MSSDLPISDYSMDAVPGVKITGTGPKSTDFIGVGIKVDAKGINALVAGMRKKVLAAKYGVLKTIANTLVGHSPVDTGYYVNNWRVNPTTTISNRDGQGDWIVSGAKRRKLKLSAAAAESLKLEVYQRLEGRLSSALSAQGGKAWQLSDNWIFYNRTPYSDAVEARHGVISAAKSIVPYAVAFSKIEAGKV